MRGESIAYILRRIQARAVTEPFSPHDLLRSFVTALLDAGEDVFAVQTLAGDADVTTTAESKAEWYWPRIRPGAPGSRESR